MAEQYHQQLIEQLIKTIPRLNEENQRTPDGELRPTDADAI
ncbi:MAG: hypothetical protein Q8N88_04270 [Nanoarchaeota archaeon]|nr:hypothetical protein [Nanoarchaeota archaeon]